MSVTNTIDRQGVRAADGVIITYAEENWNTTTGSFLNSQAANWIGQTLPYLYNDPYDGWGLTQYTPYDIGDGRNLTTGYIDTQASQNGWRQWLQTALGSMLYSDITIGPMHGFPIAFGANGGAGTTASSRDIYTWASAAGPNWRMRKVAMWVCNSVIIGPTNRPSAYPDFPQAFGIRPTALQINTYMRKNAGLFFGGPLDQGWYSNGTTAQTIAQAETYFNENWVCGPNPYPGGCEPNWAIQRAAKRTVDQFPILRQYQPVLAGYDWLPYTGNYDDQIMGGNTSGIDSQ